MAQNHSSSTDLVIICPKSQEHLTKSVIIGQVGVGSNIAQNH